MYVKNYFKLFKPVFILAIINKTKMFRGIHNKYKFHYKNKKKLCITFIKLFYRAILHNITEFKIIVNLLMV